MGAYVIGIEQVPEEVYSGRKDYRSEKYQSLAVAREISATRTYIHHQIYGVMIAPLNAIEDPDLVIMIGKAKDIMRIMQGYGNRFGMPDHQLTVGVSGVCSDLISKPFVFNDINISLLSPGAREHGSFEQDEAGTAMPIHFFWDIAKGILDTVNIVETNQAKQQILERLSKPEELGFPIRMNWDYGRQGREYRLYCEACMKYEQKEEGAGHGE